MQFVAVYMAGRDGLMGGNVRVTHLQSTFNAYGFTLCGKAPRWLMIVEPSGVGTCDRCVERAARRIMLEGTNRR